jgi:MFS superfamily sulfate permease-like transporter
MYQIQIKEYENFELSKQYYSKTIIGDDDFNFTIRILGSITYNNNGRISLRKFNITDFLNLIGFRIIVIRYISSLYYISIEELPRIESTVDFVNDIEKLIVKIKHDCNVVDYTLLKIYLFLRKQILKNIDKEYEDYFISKLDIEHTECLKATNNIFKFNDFCKIPINIQLLFRSNKTHVFITEDII